MPRQTQECLRPNLRQWLPPSNSCISAEMEKMKMEDASPIHVVMVPFPAQGHLNPMMQLASRLSAALPVTQITFVTSDRLRRAAMGSSSGSSRIQIVSIPYGTVEDSQIKGDSKGLVAMLNAAAEMEKPLEDLMRSLDGPPDFLISDSFLGWTQDVANRLAIPRIALWTASTVAIIPNLLLPQLIADGYIPVQEKLKELGNVKVAGMPGLDKLRLKDLPFSFWKPDPEDLQLRMQTFSRLKEAACVLANTFEELERDAIAGMRLLIPKFLPVGPLLPANFLLQNSENTVGMNCGIWEDDGRCLDWLDAQKPHSVIYIAFGSLANVSPLQIQEIAMGLEECKMNFLWVMRKHLVDGDDDEHQKYMEGFSKRNAGRGEDAGLVVTWAPQLRVLCHSSVAAFVSHCGWNSCMEGICSGVRILGLPCFAEQNTNCKYLVEDLKVGMALEKNEENGLVQKEEITRVMAAAMNDDEMLMNVRKMMEHARFAIREGGSSNINFSTFVNSYLLK